MAYTKTPRNGERLVRVLNEDGELVLDYATRTDLKEKLNFTKSQLGHVTAVLCGDRPRVAGYKLENIGILLVGA